MARFIFATLMIGLSAIGVRADEALPRQPGAYGSPATAKPLPADPYAGNRGLSINQLANPPGAFDRNLPLPASVPQPVLPTSLNDMPAVPPFVSPAFEPRTTPPPGIIRPQSQR